MMFFDATARSARYGKRWSGNEPESASFLSAFHTAVMKWTQKRLARVLQRRPGRVHNITHNIFVEYRDIMNRPRCLADGC